MEYTPQFGPDAGIRLFGDAAEQARIIDDAYGWLVHDPVIVAAWVRAGLREAPALAERLRGGDERMVDALMGRIIRDSRNTLNVAVLRDLLCRYKAGEDLESM